MLITGCVNFKPTLMQTTPITLQEEQFLPDEHQEPALPQAMIVELARGIIGVNSNDFAEGSSEDESEDDTPITPQEGQSTPAQSFQSISSDNNNNSVEGSSEDESEDNDLLNRKIEQIEASKELQTAKYYAEIHVALVKYAYSQDALSPEQYKAFWDKWNSPKLPVKRKLFEGEDD